jgi:hypothetical protein
VRLCALNAELVVVCMQSLASPSTYTSARAGTHSRGMGLGKRHVQGVQSDASGGPCERVSTYCQHVFMLTAGMLLVVCTRTSLKLTCPLYARSRDAIHPPARCDMRTIAE